MKYNFVHKCPACRVPWERDRKCRCGLLVCGFEGAWVYKDFGDIMVYWEDDGNCTIKHFSDHVVTDIIATIDLPFNITLKQVKLYMAFS